jgi:hypothetical protein
LPFPPRLGSWRTTFAPHFLELLGPQAVDPFILRVRVIRSKFNPQSVATNLWKGKEAVIAAAGEEAQAITKSAPDRRADLDGTGPQDQQVASPSSLTQKAPG